MLLSNFRFVTAICLATITGSFVVSAASPDYYTQTPLFLPYPKPDDKKPWNIKNLGPVGIGIDLKSPGFTMVISNVEKGSPAEKNGQLKKGQVIETISGQVLKDRDPREILGDIITEAEATDGKVSFKIKGQGEVVVSIPVLGAYSKTWPLDCPKSDKIVRNLADLLSKRNKPSWGSVIFLLSTGEEKDLQVVRRWMKDFKGAGSINWTKGMMGPGICEYYLRTGDASVLPEIKAMTEDLKKNMYNGGWSSRGLPAAFTYSTGTGQLHAAGVHCLTFLLMARLCGVDVDEYTLQESLKQFYRFAGHGNVAYGDGPPEGGFRDNGKTSGLAMAMAAAALLTPEGESSVYAKARDTSAIKSFYANSWFHAAHTGGGLGEAWHHMAISLMCEKRPIPYHSYLDARRWMMDLSRRYDGSIGIAGMTDRYDVSATESDMDFGTYLALTYTIPRKQLQMFGAPRSQWAKYYKLPVRPWGDAADDVFVSPEPLKSQAISMKDLLNEKVATDASAPVFARMASPQLDEAMYMKYFHHPDFDLRVNAMNVAVAHGRYQDIVPFLKSDDARLRDQGVQAIAGMFKGKPIPEDKLTPEMFDLIGKMIESPNESWWVTQDAINALARADKTTIARHRDRLLALLDHDSMWVKSAAVCTLTKIAVEPTQYKIVLPRIVKACSTFWNNAASYQSSGLLEKIMATASPEVKAFAVSVVKQAYSSVPENFVAKGGATQGAQAVKTRVGTIMKQLPGGDDFIRLLPKKTRAYVRTGEDQDLYSYKSFKPDPRFVGKWRSVGKRYSEPPTDKEIEASVKETFKKIEATKDKTGRGKFKTSFLILQNDGKVQGNKDCFWSGDMLIYLNEGEACRMQVRTVNGKQYLLVETGNFPEETDAEWTCGSNIYIKE